MNMDPPIHPGTNSEILQKMCIETFNCTSPKCAQRLLYVVFGLNFLCTMIALGGPWLRKSNISENSTFYDNYDSAQTVTLWGTCFEIEKGFNFTVPGSGGVKDGAVVPPVTVTFDGAEYTKWQLSQAAVILAFMIAFAKAVVGGTFMKNNSRGTDGSQSCRRGVGAMFALASVILTLGAFAAFVPTSNDITKKLMDDPPANAQYSYHIGFACAILGFILSLWNMALFAKGFGKAISFFSTITMLAVMVAVGGPWLRNAENKSSVNLFAVCYTDMSHLITLGTEYNGCGLASADADKFNGILWAQGVAFVFMLAQEALYFIGLAGLFGGSCKCCLGVAIGGICALCHLVGFSIFFSSEVTTCFKNKGYAVNAGPAFSILGFLLSLGCIVLALQVLPEGHKTNSDQDGHQSVHQKAGQGVVKTNDTGGQHDAAV